eukprot:5284203-Ditylum_brightwellii.AAC.1
MAQNVLNYNGRVVPCHSVRRLTQSELETESEIWKRVKFDENIATLLGDSITLPPNVVNPQDADQFDFNPREDDEAEPLGWINGNPLDEDGTPTFENSLIDTLINAEVLLLSGGSLEKTKVKGRHTGQDGKNIYSTLDEKGYSKVVLDATLEHSKNDQAISTSDKYIITKKEYEKSGELDDKAAFQWWVPYTLRKCDQIISAIKSRVRKTTVKYGIK